MTYSLCQIEQAAERVGTAEEVVACPRCDAPAGDDCHTRTWRKAAYLHAARIAKWSELITAELENPGRSTPPPGTASLEAPRGAWQSEPHGQVVSRLVV